MVASRKRRMRPPQLSRRNTVRRKRKHRRTVSGKARKQNEAEEARALPVTTSPLVKSMVKRDMFIQCKTCKKFLIPTAFYTVRKPQKQRQELNHSPTIETCKQGTDEQRTVKHKKCKACKKIKRRQNTHYEYTHSYIARKLRKQENARLKNDRQRALATGETPPSESELSISVSTVQYLVDTVWGGTSAIHPYIGDSSELILVRWNNSVPFSADNSILLTKRQARVHQKCLHRTQDELILLYGKERYDAIVCRLQQEEQRMNF